MFAGAQAVDTKIGTGAAERICFQVPYFDRVTEATARSDVEI